METIRLLNRKPVQPRGHFDVLFHILDPFARLGRLVVRREGLHGLSVTAESPNHYVNDYINHHTNHYINHYINVDVVSSPSEYPRVSKDNARTSPLSREYWAQRRQVGPLKT